VITAIIIAAIVGLQNHGTATRQASKPGKPLTTSQIAARVNPGLVDVVTTLGFQRAQAAGTGMVLSSSGVILTNNHVIEGATSIEATDVGNGRTYRAKVVGYDRAHDVAVLQLVSAAGLQTVSLGNSGTARAGQKVTAIGNAGGKGGTPSVVTGTIVGLNASVTASDATASTSEQLTGLIAHNAPIRPGDSGGPLVNSYAQVLGMDTAGGHNMRLNSTQAFAIPINQALAIAHRIEAGRGAGAVHIGATAFMGVEVQSAQQAAASGIAPGTGASVIRVIGGSPAANGGIHGGDLITSVAGQRVGSPESLQLALEQHHPGDQVTIGWIDPTGQRHSASIVLSSGPAG
jgi:S1-C subfamily serine protease